MDIKDRLQAALKAKKIQGFTWIDLAKNLPVSGEALRIAFKRGSVQLEYLEVIEETLGLNKHIKHSTAEKYMSFQNEINVNDPKEIFQTKAGSTYEELGDGKYLITVPLIPVKAQARYVSEFSDADYISEMKKVSFIVDRVGNGKYQAFEIKNDSMNDGSIKSIPDGAIVLGRELGRQHWRDKLKINGFPYWIIVHKETVLCKEITAHDVENGVITCHSLNSSPEYQDFKIKLDDCHQLFNIVKKQI